MTPHPDSEAHHLTKFNGYCSRWDFTLRRCFGKDVLHLGCVGETDGSLEDKVRSFAEGLAFHCALMRAGRDVVGIDLDQPALRAIEQRCGIGGLYCTDVEHLEQLQLDRTFDVIVFGDLIEHLTCPGLALDGIRRFMHSGTELVVSTPNSFGLVANLRFSTGRFAEGREHVASHNRLTLENLLHRHNFEVTEMLTCYDRPPRSWRGRLRFSVGVPFFLAMPNRGGTLLAVAKHT